jgi:hypothetical protein
LRELGERGDIIKAINGSLAARGEECGADGWTVGPRAVVILLALKDSCSEGVVHCG